MSDVQPDDIVTAEHALCVAEAGARVLAVATALAAERSSAMATVVGLASLLERRATSVEDKSVDEAAAYRLAARMIRGAAEAYSA